MYPWTLSTFALVSGLALAQNDTNATNTTICPRQRDIDQAATGSINSTGSEALTWNYTTGRDRNTAKPWYMSVLVNNTGEPFRDNGGTIAWPYLSVPNDVNASACVYSFASRNATSTGSGSRDVGCAGVLTNGCTEYLRSSIMNQAGISGGSEMRCSLPSLSPDEHKQRDEACGDLGNMGLVSYKNVGNETCTSSALSGVDLPDDYVTRLFGISLSPFDASPGARWDNYADMAYDLNVVQSTPFAVVASFNSDGQVQRDIQFVCVTPNNTQPGSRAVENKTPWVTSDASVGWRVAPGLSVLATCAISLLLAL